MVSPYLLLVCLSLLCILAADAAAAAVCTAKPNRMEMAKVKRKSEKKRPKYDDREKIPYFFSLAFLLFRALARKFFPDDFPNKIYNLHVVYVAAAHKEKKKIANKYSTRKKVMKLR